MLVARLESGVEAALTQVKGVCGAIQEGTDLVLLCTPSFLQRHPASFASVLESSWCLDSNKARKRIAWRPKLDSHALGVWWLSGGRSACNAGDEGSILDREDPLEKEMATHSSVLAWKIPRPEEPGGLQSQSN